MLRFPFGQVEAEQRDPNWFNSTTNYERVTDKALATQVEVFRQIAAELPPKMERNPADIRSTAVLAARAGAAE